jgi:hypothetical protein
LKALEVLPVAANPDQRRLIPENQVAVVIDLDLKHIILAKTKEKNKVFRRGEQGRARRYRRDQENPGSTHPSRDMTQDLVPPGRDQGRIIKGTESLIHGARGALLNATICDLHKSQGRVPDQVFSAGLRPRKFRLSLSR